MPNNSKVRRSAADWQDSPARASFQKQEPQRRIDAKSQQHVADQSQSHLALPPVSEQDRLDFEWFDRSPDDGLEGHRPSRG